MNKQRRKALDDVHTELLGITLKLEEIKSDLDSILEAEQEARDSIPENMQSSERYERMDEICGTLEDGEWSIDDAAETIENLMGELWDIIQGN